MPYTKGIATGINDLVAKIVEWATDAAIHGADAWELMRSEPWPRGTIFKAKGINEKDHCYIGLLPLDIQTGITYRNWLMTPENVGKYIMWSANGLGLRDKSFVIYGNSISVIDDKFADKQTYTSYNVQSPELFAKSCKALVFGVFKQYAANLNWDEQPGAIQFDSNLGLYPLTITTAGSSDGIQIQPPLYPGVGYPGFGMDYDAPVNGYFNFWATKDARRITVVIQNQDCWDVGHAGMLIPYHSKMQYPFPGVVAGSNSGLMMKGQTVRNSPVIGGVFDYTQSKWMLTRGMPPFATSIKDSDTTISQVGLCLPDGSWQFFANWVQGITLYSDNNTYYYPVGKPTRPAQINYTIKPTCTDLSGTIKVYPGNDTYQLEPIDLMQDKELSKNIYGRLWRMQWPSRKIPVYGEVTINDKLHLILPNVEEQRPWYISHGYTKVWNPETLSAMQKEIGNNTKQMNCVIRLED